MADVKINIGDKKAKKTHNKTLTAQQAQALQGKKIGDTFSGDILDLSGYTLEICGGSDATGIPMRKDVQGVNRKRILIVNGVGLRKTKYKGSKIRKLVAGNTISNTTAQINTKVVKYGKEPIEKPESDQGEEESSPENKE